MMSNVEISIDVKDLMAYVKYNGDVYKGNTVDDVLGVLHSFINSEPDVNTFSHTGQSLTIDGHNLIASIKESHYFKFTNKLGYPFDFNGILLYANDGLSIYVTFSGNCLVLTEWTLNDQVVYDYDIISYGAVSDMKRKLNQSLKNMQGKVNSYIMACKALDIDYVIHL